MPPPAGPDLPDPIDHPCEGPVDDPLRRVDAAAGAEPAGPLEPAGPALDWEALPEPVRLRLATVAASAVAAIPGSVLPPAVRPIAKFAPAKRARLGSTTLLTGLRDSPPFRAAVTEWAREHRPDLVDTAAVDVTVAAAAAVLLGAPSAAAQVAAVARHVGIVQLRAERDAALAKADRLTMENQRLRGELAAAAAAAQRAGTAGEAETDRMRARLREQGVRLRQALDRADESATGRDTELAEARQALTAMAAERDRERERSERANRRAERAAAEAERARQAAREARAADEVRLALLVDTVAGAVTGLRRELALSDHAPADDLRPADLLHRGSVLRESNGRVDDPGTLDRLLALPVVHLVVDGYNVTKTGYPALTLSDQRDRLTGQLAALAARTSVEITVVFDGAAVVAVPTTSRGVRVLFSDTGVPADDVICDLVVAEPQGRPVVVVTSDQAVVQSVRSCGAYSVPSTVLLARLSRS